MSRARKICSVLFLLISLPICAVAGEGWTRFDGGPLIRGQMNGKNHIYSIGVETAGARRVLVIGYPVLVLDTETNQVFKAPPSAVHQGKHHWMVAVNTLPQLTGARMDVHTGKDGQTYFHVQWPGHTIRFATDRVTLHPTPVETAHNPTPVPHISEPHIASQAPAGSVMKPLGHGLRWGVPLEAGPLPAPRVMEVETPGNLPLRFQPIGKSYQITLRGPAPRVPVELELPLPPRAFKGHIAVIRTENGRHSVLSPIRIDAKRRTVTVATSRFGTWTGALWNLGYPAAEVTGNISLRPGCEEEPDNVYFEVTRTSGGRYANFDVTTDGLGGYRVYPPIPENLFGTYSFNKLIGFSDHFIFGHLSPDPSQNITEKKHYVQDLYLVPISGRLKGRVVDRDGKPVGGARVTMLQGDSVHPAATTDAAGRFTIELIGLQPPSNDPSKMYPVRYQIKKGEDACDTTEGTVDLKAGVTTHKTLTFEPRGELRGVVRDRDDEPVAGAQIELVDKQGGTHITTTSGSGDYLLEEIPTGAAFVTATCPKNEDQQFGNHTVRCKKNDEYQRLDFTLNCRRPGRYRVTLCIGRGDPTVAESRIEGSLLVSISKDGRVSGSGTGTLTLSAASGACHGSQPVVIRASGQRHTEEILLDLDFDDGGAPLSWRCGGVPTPIPEALVSLEDEGRGLKLRIESKKPLHATLNRNFGSGPARFFSKVTLAEQ